MPRLSDALFRVFTRIDGSRFRGHLTTTAIANTKDRAPYRVLYVKNPTFIKPGDVVRSYNGEYIILMDHPSDFDWANSFKAVFCNSQLPWVRRVEVEDPVSRVPRTVDHVSMGTIYANLDNPSELGLEGLVETGYRFITGQDVQEGDLVDNLRVRRIVSILGIKVVYVA